MIRRQVGDIFCHFFLYVLNLYFLSYSFLSVTLQNGSSLVFVVLTTEKMVLTTLGILLKCFFSLDSLLSEVEL